MINRLKKNMTAGKYIGSGLLKTAIHAISGFIVLRWLEPQSLGQWQSFTVFVGYLQILTLGVTSGLNRELPYWLGKGDVELGMARLKTAGYYITALSLISMLVIVIISLILKLIGVFSLNQSILMIFAFSIGALSIQTNFLGATFRSEQAFDKLTKVQLFNTLLYVFLIPLVYFFELWGYVAYQTLLALALYLGYQHFKPYKVAYSYDKQQLKDLIKIGFPMYLWNYLASISRSIPTLVLVLFGSPLLVGLFSPAGSINAAMMNLPNYTNRYLFPQMSFIYGKTGDKRKVYNYSLKSAAVLFIIMAVAATILCFLIPVLFTTFFPKFVDGSTAAQIMIFSGVFYSINSLFHNTLNSLNVVKAFKFIVFFRILYIVIFTVLAFQWTNDLLISVALGSVIAEFLNTWNYIYMLIKTVKAK